MDSWMVSHRLTHGADAEGQTVNRVSSEWGAFNAECELGLGIRVLPHEHLWQGSDGLYDLYHGLSLLKRGEMKAAAIACEKNDTFVEELEEFAAAVRGGAAITRRGRLP
jgi:hypothetical protein